MHADEDRILRAAKTLRAHIDKLAEPDQPWRVEYLGAQGYPQRITNDRAALLAETFDGDAPPWPGTTNRYAATAEYIALVHPPVALATAEMLEQIAPLAPYWAEPYAAPFVPLIAKVIRLAREILRDEP